MAQAQAPAPLKIGITEGFSGVYADLNLGEVEAAQMAIDDFGGKVLGRPIEILSADHQTKPDIGAQIARKWFDVDGVKMITGIGTSSVALAVRKIAQEKGKIDINTGAASADLTGPACSETGAHWVYDTYALAKVTGSAHRQGRRRHLVLPHRRLRVRPRARARRDRRRDGVGRQGAGRRQASAQRRRTSRRSCCRRRPRRPRSSASPMPARTPSTRSSRPASSASSRAARSWPASWSSRPT